MVFVLVWSCGDVTGLTWAGDIKSKVALLSKAALLSLKGHPSRIYVLHAPPQLVEEVALFNDFHQSFR